MKFSAITFASCAVVADALATRSGCQFHIEADGAVSGDVGQASSGQVRYGSGISGGTFTLTGGQIFDSMGRGCFFTPPTETLQCDTSTSGASGFSIGCNGMIAYNGQTTFYECDVGDGSYNIYSLGGQGLNCRSITLMADNCHAPCPTSQPMPTTTAATSKPSSCPANLNGMYQFPHLIIPVSSSQPNTAYGTQYFGQVSPDMASLFNFDIPASYSGKTCTAVFLFPTQSQLTTSSFTISGSGSVNFAMLSSPAMSSTTYANMPSVMTDYGTTMISPGNSYVIATFSCPAGQAVGFEMSTMSDTCLKYFQDYNPSPIGMYITAC